MAPRAPSIAVSVEIPWPAGGGGAPPDATKLSQELRVLWIVEQVRQHRVGIGKAAELAGLPRAGFMRVLGEHGVPVIDYSVDDFKDELAVLAAE